MREKSGNKQTPWVASNLEGEFYFTSPSNMTDLKPSTVQPFPLQPEPVIAPSVEHARELQAGELIYTDPQTGLQWASNGNISGNMMRWDDAMNWAKNLNYAGYSDWRLPTKDELASFAKRGGNGPSEYFNANGFNSVQSSGYWSGSTYAGSTSSAWIVGMNYGNVYNGSKFYDGYYVWPVRSGQW